MADNCVMIHNTEELQEVFSKAAEQNTPVYVYQKAEKGMCLDLSSMNSILEIDTDNLVATVEPGVKMGDLAKALQEKGLRYVPADTPFYHGLTVGEFIYRGSPNISSWKYGAGKFFLMGGEFVLPTGEKMMAGGKTVKNVTGYDMVRFFTGAYSDLAVGVKFLLKLLPLPEKRLTLRAEFADWKQMLSYIGVLREQQTPSAYLLWVDPAVRALLENHKHSSQLLLFQLDGVAEEVEQQAVELKKILKQYQGLNIAAMDEKELQTWQGISGLFAAEEQFVLAGEYKVPFTIEKSFVRQAYDVIKKAQADGGLFGQMGEGKIHLRFAKLGEQEKRTIAGLPTVAKQLGGVTSGIFERLYGNGPEGQLADLERKLKQRFDPQNILNRGKVVAV